VARAAELKVEIVLPRHRNPPDGDDGPYHWEIWLRDHHRHDSSVALVHLLSTANCVRPDGGGGEGVNHRTEPPNPRCESSDLA
jgi:hypothetical protein